MSTRGSGRGRQSDREALRIGIAGWSYDDWEGIVYPGDCKDKLTYVADFVELIEINSSFYRVPRQSIVARWAERTEAMGTLFTAKLPRRITHDRVVDDTIVADVHAGFEPLRASGRLSAMLAQFSYRLEADAAGFGLLGAIADAFDGLAPLVVELRHASWDDPDAWERVADLGFSLAHLDYPGAFDGGGSRVFGRDGLAYLRLHGRNRKNWFSKDAGRDATYDWTYSSRQRAEIEERIRELLADAARVLVVANNHFRGQALKVALELSASARDRKVAVPEPMLAHFPQLRSIALPTDAGGQNVQGRLF